MQYKKIEGWFDSSDVALYEEMVLSAKDGAFFVEIGCFKGRSTVAMCELIEKHNKKISFFAIDHFKGSWEHQNDPTVKDLFKIFLENTRKHNKRFMIIPQPSEQAAHIFENNSLDFVYIDASHDYESVKQDLNLWHPKLKIDGIIGGHDYEWDGVKQAVDEFANENGKQIKRYGYASWKLI